MCGTRGSLRTMHGGGSAPSRCARVTAGPKRPHLSVCPGPNFPLQGRQGPDSLPATPKSPPTRRVPPRGTPRVPAPLPLSPFSPPDVRLLATPWTTAHQAPPSMGFSKQEYWSGLPFLRATGNQVGTGTKGTGDTLPAPLAHSVGL